MLFRSNDTATTEIYTCLDTLSLHDALPIPVEVVEREAAGEDLSGGDTRGESRGDRGDRGDRPREGGGDRDRGDRDRGERSGESRDGHRRTRHRTRGHHE